MRLHFLVAAGLGLALPAAAQSDLYTDSRQGSLNNRYAQGYFMTPREPVAAQGSVFLVPAWTPGTLQMDGWSRLITASLKYDVYNQEVRLKKSNSDSIAVPVARVKEFSLAARRFVCYPAPTLPPDVGGGCSEILYTGPAVQLLRFERKTLEKRGPPARAAMPPPPPCRCWKSTPATTCAGPTAALPPSSSGAAAWSRHWPASRPPLRR